MRISMCLSDQIHLNNIEYKSGHSNISKKMDPEYEVKRILKEKDLYKILTVNKNATEADIKEKYKKIAKIVHPDRCHTEEATGAFQKLAHAYHVLSNPDERSNYDKYGDESPRPQQTYAYREEEVYPDDIFSFFFGVPPDPRRRAQARQARNNEYYGYPGNANQQQRRQNQNHQNQQGDNIPLNFMSNLISIFMMLFFIFLLLGAFDLSSLSLYFSNPASRKNLKGLIFFNEPPSSHYTIKQTKKYRVRFYIPNWWINNQRMDLRSHIIDRATIVADELYEEELRIKCELEKNQFGHEGKQCSLKKRILNE